MRWEHTNSDDAFQHLSVEADWEELQPDYQALLKEYAKLTVPGFRPGKAPASLIEKRFQSSIIDDLSKGTAQRFGRKAIHESEIKVWGNAEIVGIECAKEQPFRADLRYHPLPEIELPDLRQLMPEDDDGDPQDQISLALLKDVELAVPSRLVEEELDLEGIKIKPGNKEWTAAEKRIKLLCILKQIALQEGIEIDETDLQTRIAEKAEEFGTSAKTLRAELAAGDGSDFQRLKDMLLAESTLDYLVEINIKANNI